MNKKHLISQLSGFILFTVFLSYPLDVSPASDNGSKPAPQITIRLDKGILALEPLNRNAVRVRFSQEDSKPMNELVYIEKRAVPKHKITESSQSLSLTLEGLVVIFDKQSQSLQFYDKKGNILLREKIGGRIMKKSKIQDEPIYMVEQQFISPSDEYIYGTGQFQDGYLNIRGLTRN